MDKSKEEELDPSCEPLDQPLWSPAALFTYGAAGSIMMFAFVN